MSGLPFFKFYPSDFMRDTRALSCVAKGAWIDILCVLHGSSRRGVLTHSLAGWARIVGMTSAEIDPVLDELDATEIAEVIREGNNNVTISNRRMLRDSITREQTRLRVQKHRRNADCNAPGNTNVTGKKPEARSQKPENTIQPEGAAASVEALANDESPVVLLFSCAGREPSWPLHESFLNRLRELYPTIDPLAEAKIALAKIDRGAVSKKTAKGMPRFLFSWMDRATNNRQPNHANHRPGNSRSFSQSNDYSGVTEKL